MIIDHPELGKVDTEQGFTEAQTEIIDKAESDNLEQPFSDALELHKAIDKKIGLEGLSDFHKALEAGDKPKARRIANALPNSNPLKKDLLKLLDLV